jgi:hypothetical protein
MLLPRYITERNPRCMLPCCQFSDGFDSHLLVISLFLKTCIFIGLYFTELYGVRIRIMDKKTSPQIEHVESSLKADPSTLIPDPEQERQPYGASGIPTILYVQQLKLYSNDSMNQVSRLS